MPTVARKKRTKKVIRELIQEKRIQLNALRVQLGQTIKRGVSEKDAEKIVAIRERLNT